MHEGRVALDQDDFSSKLRLDMYPRSLTYLRGIGPLQLIG